MLVGGGVVMFGMPREKRILERKRLRRIGREMEEEKSKVTGEGSWKCLKVR